MGAELTPEMLARARQRMTAAGWQNVSLVQANAEELDVGEQFEGILAYCTHDIMSSPIAVERAVAHLKPGGRFVAVGLKRATGWLTPLNAFLAVYLFVFPLAVNWDRETARRPWANLERKLGPLEVRERFFGTWYQAVGQRAL